MLTKKGHSYARNIFRLLAPEWRQCEGFFYGLINLAKPLTADSGFRARDAPAPRHMLGMRVQPVPAASTKEIYPCRNGFPAKRVGNAQRPRFPWPGTAPCSAGRRRWSRKLAEMALANLGLEVGDFLT